MTVWDISKMTAGNVDQFAIHCGNFLDEFYRSGNDHRRLMVEKEPEGHPSFPDYMLPFLAAMVHKLCNDHHIRCPDWVHHDRYILPEPHFWLNATGNLKQLLLEESPHEFRIRNLFVTADTLTRV